MKKKTIVMYHSGDEKEDVKTSKPFDLEENVFVIKGCLCFVSRSY